MKLSEEKAEKYCLGRSTFIHHDIKAAYIAGFEEARKLACQQIAGKAKINYSNYKQMERLGEEDVKKHDDDEC